MLDSKPVGYREFCRLVAKKASSANIEMADKWISCLVEVILDELILSGTVRIKNLGVFTLKDGGGYSAVRHTRQGTLESYYVEPYYMIKFRSYKGFRDAVNKNKVFDISRQQQQKLYDKAKLEKEEEEFEKEIAKYKYSNRVDFSEKWDEYSKQKEKEKIAIKKELEEKAEAEFERKKHAGKKAMRKGEPKR